MGVMHGGGGVSRRVQRVGFMKPDTCAPACALARAEPRGVRSVGPVSLVFYASVTIVHSTRRWFPHFMTRHNERAEKSAMCACPRASAEVRVARVRVRRAGAAPPAAR